MKKSLLILTLLAFSFAGIHAKEAITKTDTVIMVPTKRNVVKKDIPGRGFAKSVEVSASALPKDVANVSLVMLNGYRFNKYIFIGGGIGITYLYEKDVWEYGGNKEVDIDHSVGIPVFFRAKFNFTNKRVSPFFGVDLGVALLWDVDHEYSYDYVDPRFIFRPHIGLDINVSEKIKPYIMVGGSVDCGALFFGVGCKF
ncbi:MAG: hypothetical protein NC048_04445 [Bacteroides sp.]|nr:hypothetical protein [Ruminococcus flavefaciens]MCM1554725.1 hypothetical protein [Bacteroides sp.]